MIVYLAIFGTEQLQILWGASSWKPFAARLRLFAAPHLALMWRIVDPKKAARWRGLPRGRNTPHWGELWLFYAPKHPVI